MYMFRMNTYSFKGHPKMHNQNMTRAPLTTNDMIYLDLAFQTNPDPEVVMA